MKSHSPKRRKQAVHVARPAIWPSSACQPNSARDKAELLIVEDDVASVEGSGVVARVAGADERSAAEGCGEEQRIVLSCSDIDETSKFSGVEGSGGSSDAMARRESYLWRRLAIAVA